MRRRFSRPTAEELALAELLAKLVEDYDAAHYPIPKNPPHEILGHLMEQHGLRQVDIAPLVGSRGQVSLILSGRRGMSKRQAIRLAEFFHVSAELFL